MYSFNYFCVEGLATAHTSEVIKSKHRKVVKSNPGNMMSVEVLGLNK